MRNLRKNPVWSCRIEVPVLLRLPGVQQLFENGNNGIFSVDSPEPEGGVLRIIATDIEWDHVSVSREDRTPTWREMQFVKDLFFEDEEAVIQIHPRRSEYVNNHPFCLHLWRWQGGEFPLPSPEHVGIIGM